MITGIVRAGKAFIHVEIQDGNGVFHKVEALVDTGFSGFLTLPLEWITELGLTWYNIGNADLANGTTEEFDLYQGQIVWDGGLRKIEVEQAEIIPLIGMELLAGHDLAIRVVEGGAVTIMKIP